jgi:hypothetical protein
VSSILAHIDNERADMARAGLRERFDAELKSALTRLDLVAEATPREQPD